MNEAARNLDLAGSMESTIGSKGQVTVPKAVRDQLHLRPGDRVEFLVESDGSLRVVPVTASVTALKGMVSPPKQPLSLDDLQ
ncbi:MAG TPA: AbrB/MazE/SpoVT family DNA-binding domain-containing protein [Gammaproteobacteria bacterium]|nr:AbrB/MazE/SpoVT family DNA-binding domain-containing protein [Gammaproteobacteria bacterium]